MTIAESITVDQTKELMNELEGATTLLQEISKRAGKEVVRSALRKDRNKEKNSLRTNLELGMYFNDK